MKALFIVQLKENIFHYLKIFCIYAKLLILIFSFSISSAYATTSIPFTINLDDTVTVTGTPRIQMDIGGATRYAIYTSGSGSSALVFTYTMVSGDVDADGVTLVSPIQLNGERLKMQQGMMRFWHSLHLIRQELWSMPPCRVVIQWLLVLIQ